MKKLVESVILARGGSKGIPQKNIIDLNGKPLISYTIRASLKSNCQNTWVSTDDDEIAFISKKYGASVIKRPPELATDFSPSEDALKHFFEIRPYVDVLVFIQPTSPLLKSHYINRGIDIVLSKGYDSAFSGYIKDWNAEFNEKIEPINWDLDNRPRRQDIGPIFVENGAFYVTTKTQFLSTHRRYGGKIGFVEMSQFESIQIDSYKDYENAKMLLSLPTFSL